MCIICFLKDSYQYNLRKNSMMRSDRIEHTIDRYKYIFAELFKENLDHFCSKHDNESNRKINNALKKINTKDIIVFFDIIRKVYINWINTQIGESIKSLHHLLRDYQLFGASSKIQSEILFRGRKSKNFISHWDMFHIPFNKRYLIENQRYSLTGQPILYLSSSPYGIVKELETIENVRISTFRMNENVVFKIYENVNQFTDIIVDTKELTDKQSAEYILNSEIIDDTNQIILLFYKMILSSCCSFERREDTKKSSFSEEYVLPQILTLVLKQEGYDGIKYISTKSYVDKDIIDIPKILNVLYSNICLFTDYTETQSRDVKNVYDRELYDKFILSNPHKYSDFFGEDDILIKDTIDELNKILDSNDENIKQYENQIMVNIGNMLNEIYEFKQGIGDNDKNNFNKLRISLNSHVFLLKNIILNIKENKIKMIERGFKNE